MLTCDRLRIEQVRATREAASVAEEQQHDGEAEPVRSAFRCHESVVGRCQVPAAIARAGRVARQDVHDEIVAVGSAAGQIEEDLARRPVAAAGGREGVDDGVLDIAVAERTRVIMHLL
jgi:hypothetical protein